MGQPTAPYPGARRPFPEEPRWPPTSPRRPRAKIAAPIQRRTVRLLFVTQIIGGVGVTIGVTVGALLAARIAGTAVAGLAQSAGVVGGALLAVPVTRIMTGYGRRPGLVTAYLVRPPGACWWCSPR